MEKTVKRKWVEALRSRRFKKGQGALKTDVGYCCLGVLCEVTGTPFQPHSCFLPVGLSRKAGVLRNRQKILAALNDGCWDAESDGPAPKGYRYSNGASFRAIASYIEKTL